MHALVRPLLTAAAVQRSSGHGVRGRRRAPAEPHHCVRYLVRRTQVEIYHSQPLVPNHAVTRNTHYLDFQLYRIRSIHFNLSQFSFHGYYIFEHSSQDVSIRIDPLSLGNRRLT